MKDQESFIIDIADIVISIVSNQDELCIKQEKNYQSFLSTRQPHIFIYMLYDVIPQIVLRDEDLIFDSEGPWSLCQINGKNAIVFGDSVSGSLPSRIALFDNDMRKIEVYSESELLPNGLLPDPLQYPLGEVLMICLLAQRRGLMIHACGIDDNGQGYLFAGNSTHGKTTMARIWKDKAVILNDDRIVIRKKGDRFWMYGTPWHGEYPGVSPQGVPIEKVFFLQHAESNNTVKCKDLDAVSMLLTRCFPPLWDTEGMQFTLDFCAQLVDVVPCYKLDFVPNKDVLDFVRCVK